MLDKDNYPDDWCVDCAGLDGGCIRNPIDCYKEAKKQAHKQDKPNGSNKIKLALYIQDVGA